jgi:hypothetical protein
MPLSRHFWAALGRPATPVLNHRLTPHQREPASNHLKQKSPRCPTKEPGSGAMILVPPGPCSRHNQCRRGAPQSVLPRAIGQRHPPNLPTSILRLRFGLGARPKAAARVTSARRGPPSRHRAPLPTIERRPHPMRANNVLCHNGPAISLLRDARQHHRRSILEQGSARLALGDEISAVASCVGSLPQG